MEPKKKALPIEEDKINRKEALKKIGKYTAFTAASMMLLMSEADGKPIKKSAKKPRG
jgi:hypothetical protein